MRAVHNPVIDESLYTLPIEKGGTAAMTTQKAAQNLGLVTNAMKGQPGGPVPLDSNGKVPLANLPSNLASGAINLQANFEIAINSTVQFTITDYDSFKNYTVTSNVGLVVRTNDVISYTAPATPQTMTLTVNGRQFNFNIVQPQPAKPSITSPINGAVNAGPGVTVTSSAFVGVGSGLTHQSTDWQLATDASFTNVVQSSIDDTVNKTVWNFGNINTSTTYYLRCRYKANNGNYGSYSNTITFVTKASFYPIIEEIKLMPSPVSNTLSFGQAVAISSDGSRVAVGSPAENSARGSAYVFLRTGNSWALEQKIANPAAGNSDQFGISVSFDSNATRVAIGANGSTVSGVSACGSVYIFVRSGTSWSQEQQISASDKASTDLFGYSAELDSDATRIVVGAYGSDPAGVSGAGAAYIFVRAGSVWTQEQKLTATSPASSDSYGYDVDIDSTGTRCIVGSMLMNPGGVNDSGAIEIWTRSGTVWTREQQISASDKAASDQFGYKISIDSSGSTIASCAASADVGGITNAGAVYIFVRSGAVWSQQAKLGPSDPVSTLTFGYSACLDATGNMLVACSYSPASNALSAAYIFDRAGSTWTQRAKVNGSDEANADRYGWDSAISSDGTRMIIGAYQKNSSPSTAVGAAYIYR